MYLIEKNEDTLNEYLLKEDMDLVTSAIKSFHERHEVSNTESSSWFSFSSAKNDDVSPIVVAYGDEKSEEDLVYGVGVEK